MRIYILSMRFSESYLSVRNAGGQGDTIKTLFVIVFFFQGIDEDHNQTFRKCRQGNFFC